MGRGRGNGSGCSTGENNGQSENADNEFHDEEPLYGFQMTREFHFPCYQMLAQVTRVKLTFLSNIRM
jgi:hypothetical protein